ncbi:MAG: metallophosphoesterase [Promethearchaeia archaeon]
MKIFRSTKFKLTLLKISLIVPLAFLIILPLFLSAYAEYLYLSGFNIVGIILPAVAIFIIGMVFISIRVMILKIKKKENVEKIWPATFIFFLIIGITASTIGIWEINFFYSARHYNTGPILTWGSGQDPSTEVTIMWRTVDPAKSSISFTSDKEFSESSLNISEDSELVEWHQIGITGLNPNTTYYYRINEFDETIHSFMTAPSLNSSFNFLVFSDPRQNSADLGCLLGPNVPKYMAEKATSEGNFPEFTIVTGDITSKGTRYPTWKSWFDDISVHSELASSAPLVDVVGNHERFDDTEGDIFAKFYPLERQTNKQFYYSFNYSQIHFTMLDPWNITKDEEGGFDKLDDDQLEWAQEDLQKSMNKTFRIICLHPPPLRGKNDNINNRMPRVTDLADTFNVSLVFFGHGHSYEHNLINGTHYVLNGVGGNLDPKISGYAEVQATQNTLKLMQHWLNDTTHDIAEIPA